MFTSFSTPSNKRKAEASMNSHRSPSISGVDSDDSDAEKGEGEKIAKKGPGLSPALILLHLDEMKEMFDKKKMTAKAAFASYASSHSDDATDSKELERCLTRYLTLSLNVQRLDVDTGMTMMKEFLQSSAALKFFPDYPSKPSTALTLYCKAKGISQFSSEAKESMSKDTKGRAAAEKTHEAEKTAYYERMRDFLEVHGSSLSAKQKKQVEQSILRNDKAKHPENYKREPKKKKQPKTAFEIFYDLEQAKYADLSEEKRLKKLKKKYEKLDDNVRDVYMKLALR